MSRMLKGVQAMYLGVVPTVAALPAASAANRGWTAFVSNALKASETTGTGTGNLCYSDGTAWRRVDTGATATA